jgi:hypothetical protein
MKDSNMIVLPCCFLETRTGGEEKLMANKVLAFAYVSRGSRAVLQASCVTIAKMACATLSSATCSFTPLCPANFPFRTIPKRSI